MRKNKKLCNYTQINKDLCGVTELHQLLIYKELLVTCFHKVLTSIKEAVFV